MGRGWFLHFKFFSGGIQDMEKGCFVAVHLRAGKPWIGVGTAWSGPALVGVSHESSLGETHDCHKNFGICLRDE